MIVTLVSIFIVLVGVFCIIVYNVRHYASEGWFGTGIFTLLIGGICLLFCVGAISTKEVMAQSYIAKIEAVRESFQHARINKDIHLLELAAIQQKIAEKNEWIANAKYWAKHPLTNWFWDKRILEIKPIK